MKKWILHSILLLSLFPSAGFANSNTQQKESNSFTDGFYGGGRAGVFRLNGKSVIKESFPQVEGPVSDHSHDAHTFGSIGVHVGYLYNYGCSGFALAPEVLIEYNTTSIKQEFESDSYQYKTTMPLTLGANLRGGMIVQDNIFIYGLIGAKVSQFTFKVNDVTTNKSIARTHAFSPAMVYGAGIEFEMENCHRLRFEYTYSHYKKVHLSTFSHDGNSQHSSKLRPKVSSVSLIYSIPF